MKRLPLSKLPLILIAAVLVLLLMALTWSRTANPFGSLKGSVDPSGVMFVSKDAPLSLSLGINPDRLLTLKQPLSFGPSKTQEELTNFRDSILGLGELDYTTQITPWLGDEITLAVTSLDVDRDLTDGRQPGYLLVLRTIDPAASKAFLKTFWRIRSPLPAILTTEAYQGTEITYGKIKSTLPTLPKTNSPKTDIPFTLASAVVGDRYVLFANSPKVLKNSINNVQAPDLNLRNSPIYQKSIAALNPNNLGQLYINLPQFTALTGDRTLIQALAQLPDPSPVNYTHLTLGLKATRSGLIADTVLLSEDTLPTEPTTTRTKPEPTPHPVLQYLPANSMAIAVGSDLGQMWTNIEQTVKGYPALEKLQTNTIAPLNAQSQLDLVKDLFPWVKGDYGMALLPPKGNAKNNNSIDWVFAVKHTAEVESSIAKLDKIARDRGFNIGPVNIGSQTLQAWTKLSSQGTLTNIQAKAIAAHTTIGEFEIFSTSLETLEGILTSTSPTLGKNSEWQQINQEIPTGNNGYLSLDWPSAKPLIEKQVPGLRLLELLAQPIVTHLKSFTLSSSGIEDHIAKGTIGIGLK